MHFRGRWRRQSKDMRRGESLGAPGANPGGGMVAPSTSGAGLGYSDKEDVYSDAAGDCASRSPVASSALARATEERCKADSTHTVMNSTIHACLQ